MAVNINADRVSCRKLYVDEAVIIRAPVYGDVIFAKGNITITDAIENANELVTKNYVDDIIVGETASYKIISAVEDLPAAVNNIITLSDNTAYFITTNIDLLGARLVFTADAALLGTTSETSSLTSTGLADGIPLITTTRSLPMQNITIKSVHTALAIDGTDVNLALDWVGVNFLSVNTIGTILNASNFIFSRGAFLSSSGLTIDGTIGTISIDSSLFTGGSSAHIIIPATCIISRRFRILYSAFITSNVSLSVSDNASIPIESYILTGINFAGGGSYISGVDVNSDKTLFADCVGIENTFANAQMYYNDNATVTVISQSDTWYKVAGTTTPSLISKFAHSNNRLTCDATILRRYLLMCTLSFNSGANNICKFGFYDSKEGNVRLPSQIKSTANNGGRAESVSLSCVVEHSAGDYIEIHCMNTSGTSNITVTELNVIITQLK